MKVLHVIGPLTVGGAQTQLLGLLRSANGVHWHAEVGAISPGPMIEEFHAVGVPVHDLSDDGVSSLHRLRRLRALTAGQRFDVIHSNLWHPNVYARAAVIGRRTRPSVVISERNVETRRARWQQAVDAGLARWTNAWIGNSAAVCDFIALVHPVDRAAVRHIPNAVDREVFRPGPSPDGSTLKIGSIGRLFPEKGFAVLTDAVRLLVEEGVNCEVRIAGVGPLREQLIDAAQSLPIRYVGPLTPGQEVAEFLRSLHVFVLPSTHREGRANVVIEALACRVPTVVTDIAGMRETAGDEALIVPPGDARSLADAILLARSRPRPAGQGDYGFDVLAKRYLDVFLSVRAGSRSDGLRGS